MLGKTMNMFLNPFNVYFIVRYYCIFDQAFGPDGAKMVTWMTLVFIWF